MALITDFINFIIHLDQSLGSIIQQFGLWTYVILFLMIFAETGLVFTPFFPGDSLLFITGAFAASGLLRIDMLLILLTAAAIIGDTANYWIGHYSGLKLFNKKNSRFFKKEYLEMTKKFYEKHGRKTIVLARFVPIIRTFAPFVAGIGKMGYKNFITYNIVGGVVWVSIFVLGGYYFGNIPVVKENLSLAIVAIILVSFLPIAIKMLSRRMSKMK